MTYTIQSVALVHEGWSSLSVATIATPEGDIIRREIEDHGAAVAVLPYDPQRRVAMLVSQFRAPVFHTVGQSEMLEAPAGRLDEADPAAEARREAEEEAGLRLGALEHVVTGWSMPGISTEQIHLYLASYAEADRIGRGGGLAEEQEHTIAVEMRLDDLAAMADRGTLTDVKTLLLVQTLRLRRPALFVEG